MFDTITTIKREGEERWVCESEDNKYYLRIWAGKKNKAHCEPKETLNNWLDFKSCEIGIFDNTSGSDLSIGIIQTLYGEDLSQYAINYNHAAYVPIDKIKNIILKMQGHSAEAINSLIPVPEYPCVHCGKMNDEGIESCWNCTRNPGA